MNRRLLEISRFIENGKGVADIGTDHAYLPIYLAENGYEGKIIASDINEDPLRKAVNNASAAGLNERMDFVLCDGLKAIAKDEIDTIVIAGMGGDMIVKILDETEWCMDGRYKLILQPMSKAEVLRYWLVYNEFEIVDEQLVDENGSLYQIICAVFGGNTKLNDAELFIGKYQTNHNKILYIKQLDAAIKRFEKAAMEIEGSTAAPGYRAKLFKEIASQLVSMRKQYDDCK